MTEALEPNTLQRWRSHPTEFIEQVLCDPETGKPFQLFEAQKQFFKHAWQRDSDGHAVFPEQCLVVYPDPGMRLAISRAVAIEAPRGWRIGKDKQTHKIDVVVALAMACHAAIQSQREPEYDNFFRGWSDPPAADPEARARAAAQYQHARLAGYIHALSGGQIWPG